MDRHANTEDALASRGITEGGEVVKDVLIVDKGRNTIARVNEHGLTEKQELFAQAVAKGSTLEDAYRSAYDASSMANSTIYGEASRMMDLPHIAVRVKALLAIREERTHALDAKRIRQHVFDRLMVESIDEESPPAARIKALELLGKIDVVSMFKEQKGQVDDKLASVEALEAKLRTALQRMTGVQIAGTQD